MFMKQIKTHLQFRQPNFLHLQSCRYYIIFLYATRKTKAILEIEGILKSVLISAQKTAAVDLFQKPRTVGDVKCNAFIKLIALWANRSL